MGGNSRLQIRHLGVLKVDQQVVEATGEAKTVQQEKKPRMKLEEHSQVGEQEEPVAEETAGKGNTGGGDVRTEFSEECRTLQKIN